MSKEIIGSNTRNNIRDFIDDIRAHLDTVEMLDAEISEADDNPYYKDEAKTKACYELARNLVLNSAKMKLQFFDNFIVYGTQDAE